MRMTRSLKGKLLALLVAILSATAACIILLSMQDVRGSMERAASLSADNVLELVRHTVQTTYRNILSDRVQAVTSRKQQLADAGGVAADTIREFAAMARTGLLSQEEAKRRALNWIADLDLGGKTYYLVYDENLQPLAGNTGSMAGGLADVKDIKGRPLLSGMRDKTDIYGSAYAVFDAPRRSDLSPVRVLGYFTDIPEWDWVLSTGINLAAVEQEEARRRQNALEILGQSLGEIRIAASGFAFIFDQQGQLLVAPPAREYPMDRAVAGVVAPDSLATILRSAPADGHPLTLHVMDADGEPHDVDIRVFHDKPLGWNVATATFQDEIDAPANLLALRQALIIGSIFLVAFIVTAVVVDRVSEPLKRLAGHAVQIGSEDFTEPEPPAVLELEGLAKSRKDEVGLVALALRTMERSLRENVASLLQITRDRERLDAELRLARTIQMDMLPASPQAHLDTDDAELHAVLIPAREVGGDLFHYEQLGEDQLLFAVGDVSGKGVPAALFMALTMSLLRSKSRPGADPAHMLHEINQELCRGNASQMFVTLFVGILDLATGALRFASGGHNPPLVASPGGATAYLEITENPMLGILPEAEFSPHAHTIAPGEMIIAYTDGVTEAMSPTRTLFGERRLELVAGKYSDRSPELISKIVVKALEMHEKGAEQSDDVTILVLRRRDHELDRKARSIAARAEAELPDMDRSSRMVETIPPATVAAAPVSAEDIEDMKSAVEVEDSADDPIELTEPLAASDDEPIELTEPITEPELAAVSPIDENIFSQPIDDSDEDDGLLDEESGQSALILDEDDDIWESDHPELALQDDVAPDERGAGEAESPALQTHDPARETARGDTLDSYLASELGFPAEDFAEDTTEAEIIIPDERAEVDLDEEIIAQGLDDDFAVEFPPEVSLPAEALNFDEDFPAVDPEPEWSLEIPASDDPASALYLGEELEDLESDDDLPVDIPASAFAEAMVKAGVEPGSIPEPPNLDDFRLTADPEDLLDEEEDMQLLAFGSMAAEEEDRDELPPPSPAAPDGYYGEALEDGGFEVLPSPPGELYARNPELMDTTLAPADDPASFITIHSEVKVFPRYADEDEEFVLDESDENGYAEVDLGEDGDRYEDIYLDEHAIDTIEADENRGS